MLIDLMFTSEAAKAAYSTQSFRGSAFAAGIDLRAAIDNPITILPSEQVMIPTGIKLDMRSARTEGIVGLIAPRSGRGSRDGLVLGNLLGVVDEDYQGELMVCAWARPTSGHINLPNARVGGTPVHIEPFERFAQLLFVPAYYPKFNIVDQFKAATVRGAGGFGSTGTTDIDTEGGAL